MNLKCYCNQKVTFCSFDISKIQAHANFKVKIASLVT